MINPYGSAVKMVNFYPKHNTMTLHKKIYLTFMKERDHSELLGKILPRKEALRVDKICIAKNEARAAWMKKLIE